MMWPLLIHKWNLSILTICFQGLSSCHFIISLIFTISNILWNLRKQDNIWYIFVSIVWLCVDKIWIIFKMENLMVKRLNRCFLELSIEFMLPLNLYRIWCSIQWTENIFKMMHSKYHTVRISSNEIQFS